MLIEAFISLPVTVWIDRYKEIIFLMDGLDAESAVLRAWVYFNENKCNSLLSL